MKIALGIEYNGSNYFGWQKQQKVVGVQNLLEQAVNFVANQECEIFCAGRTDAGVHATNQVVHFETTANRSEYSWIRGINANLPSDIAVRWAKEVVDDFHARFSATARRYRYIILNANVASAILASGITHYQYPLDINKMQIAANALLGEHDFSAFRSSQCESNTPFRNMHFINVINHKNYVIVDIQANAFLHHMVRNIVGSLLEIGAGNKSIDWLAWLLEQKDRTLAAPTAKANGLYLVDVTYPDSFNIPKKDLGPLFLA